jgi:ABC-type uncharacterized transport system ATPase subunit
MLIDRAVGREHAAKPHAGADRKVELTAEVEIRSVRQAQSLGVTMIFQEVNLVPSRTAAQNVYLGRESRARFGAVDRNVLRRLTERVLSIVGSRERPDALISDLSVAQQQLIEIAKALSFDAKILFMDEPTSSLSEDVAQNLITLICELRSRGMAIVFTIHRLCLARMSTARAAANARARLSLRAEKRSRHKPRSLLGLARAAANDRSARFTTGNPPASPHECPSRSRAGSSYRMLRRTCGPGLRPW